MKFQDRSKWNHELIKSGFRYIDLATDGKEVTPYHLEAAIASLHAAAPSFEQTDWKSIYHLYEILYQLQPSPVVAMNKAIASAYKYNKKRALDELQQIKGLEHHHIYFASIGEMYYELDQRENAKNYFEKAIGLTQSQSEIQFLKEKISLC